MPGEVRQEKSRSLQDTDEVQRLLREIAANLSRHLPDFFLNPAARNERSNALAALILSRTPSLPFFSHDHPSAPKFPSANFPGSSWKKKWGSSSGPLGINRIGFQKSWFYGSP